MLVCILSTHTSAPKPAASASSMLAQATPPAPKSLKPTLSTKFFSSKYSNKEYVAFKMCLSKNALGSCTAPLFCCFFSSSSSKEAKLAPPKPLLSVGFPISIRSYPAEFLGALERRTFFSLTTPAVRTVTKQFSLYSSSKYKSPHMFGIPRGLPYPAIPETTPSCIQRVLFLLISPKRKLSPRAITSAPIQQTSLTLPPIPVAAPSYGTI